LLRAADRWRTLHKFAPALIEALEFRAARAGDPMLAALKATPNNYRLTAGPSARWCNSTRGGMCHP
jgi:hypothetical protein